MINVSRKSPFTGQVNTITLNIGEDEYRLAESKWKAGAYIQDAFHMLDADEREFLMTGITPDEWTRVFGSDPEE